MGRWNWLGMLVVILYLVRNKLCYEDYKGCFYCIDIVVYNKC